MSFLKPLKVFFRAKFAGSQSVIHGVTLPLDRSIFTDPIIYSVVRGRYELSEAEAAKQLLRPDDRVLELGGGVGLISTIAAKLVPQGQVVTIEANPRLVSFIERVHGLNGVRAECINAIAAGGEGGGTAKFYLRKDFWVSSMSPEPADYVDAVDVNVIGISVLVKQHKPSVVIIDIEGGEMNLIDEDWTRGVRLVMMEVHPKQTGLEGVQKLVDFFTNCGFTVARDKVLLLAIR
jgi:FkbM family methyltransferase